MKPSADTDLSQAIRRELAGLLSSARKTAGLTQEGLAVRAGVDRTYVGDLERGRKTPTLDTFFRICGALGVKPSVLVEQLDQRLSPSQARGDSHG